MKPTIPAKALSRQINAKRGAPRRKNHHRVSRQTKETMQIMPAASLYGELHRGSTDQRERIEIASNASKPPVSTSKSARCRAIYSDFIRPNGAHQPPAPRASSMER